MPAFILFDAYQAVASLSGVFSSMVFMSSKLKSRQHRVTPSRFGVLRCKRFWLGELFARPMRRIVDDRNAGSHHIRVAIHRSRDINETLRSVKLVTKFKRFLSSG
jgi:hypothetical protein